MTDKSHEIIELEASHRERAATTLARAFEEDPPINFILHEGIRTFEKRRRMMMLTVDYGLHYGEAHITCGVDGAAVWFPPGKAKITPLQQIRLGMWKVPFMLGVKGTKRMILLMKTIERMHKTHVRGPHWYLALLGVDPDSQGKGRGSALIQPTIEKADRDGLPCYLETGNESNIDFYARHGFKVMEKTIVPQGPPGWAMLREPIKIN
jgi:GNAT superfamily N-acetyltransferase